MRYCPNCGREVDDGDHFCKFCSFRLDNWTPPEEPVQQAPSHHDSGLFAYILSAILPGTGAMFAGSLIPGATVFLLSLGGAITTAIFPPAGFVTIPALVLLWFLGIGVTKSALDAKQ